MKNFKNVFRILITLLMLIIVAFFGYNSIMEHLYPKKYSEYITKYSREFGIDEELVFAVIKCESNFLPHAQSQAGAVGLMQITEATFSDVAKMLHEEAEIEFSTDALNPETNIRYGVRYIKYLNEIFGGDKTAVIAAYNAGLGNVANWMGDSTLKIEEIKFSETKRYVEKVLKAESIYINLYSMKGE